MEESMAIFADDVCELSGSVVDLTRFYTMSWVFLKAYNKKDLETVIMLYPDFMDTVKESLLQSFFITTYRLFDINAKAKDKTLRKLLNNVASFDQPLAQQLIVKMNSQHLLLRKMFHVRHKLYAHRDGAPSLRETLGSIRRQEMKAVVGLSWEIISALSDVAVNKMGHALDERVTEILKDVKKRNRRRVKFANMDAHEVLELIKKHGRK